MMNSMIPRIVFTTLIGACCVTNLIAQNPGVSINESGAAPHPSAILDLSSATQGTLITRMTTPDRNAIQNPALALTIFNTTTNCFEFFDGSGWVTLGCGCETPSAPAAISGDGTVCQGQHAVSYSIPSIPHAIGYMWSLPPGATIASGSNTQEIIVNYASNAQSGTISVYGYSASCGQGPASANFPVTVNPLPLSAGVIDGPDIACQGTSGVMYSISPITYATSYSWNFTGAGAGIIGSSASVSIDFQPTASSGSLTVTGMNACGAGIASPSLAITLSNLPGSAGSISGLSTPCINSSGNTYSISPVNGATTYSWILPSGMTLENDNGTSISVATTTSSGSISVTPINSCGSGGSSSLSVNPITTPGSPGAISGSNFLVASTGNGYAISSVGGATSYTWSITPAGATIASGQGTTSISVDYPSVTTSYTICVAPINSCGSSGPSCIDVNVFTNKQVFTANGSNQTFNVPSGVNQVFVKLWGAGGGGGINYSGGAGAYVSGKLNVTSNTDLTVIVGGKGLRASGTTAALGGFGGGGASGASNNVNSFAAGSGGGRSSLQITPGTDAVTAGAGGGCGTGNSGQNDGSFGGGGGAPNGSAGGDNNSGTQGGPGGGKGGTTTSGGAGTTAVSPAVNSSAGSLYTASAGGSAAYAGGGGGGGYYGGSGGAGSSNMTVLHAVGGGGGGSSFTTNLIAPVTNLAGNHGATVTGTIAAPNNSDPDYISGVGTGGYYSNNGGDGLVVVYW